MSDPLTDIRDKYFQALIGRIVFHRVVVFLVFLLALVAPRSDLDKGLLLGLASIRLDSLFLSHDAILLTSRLGDVILALVATVAIAYAMHWLRMISFRWFVRIRRPDDLMRQLARNMGEIGIGEAASKLSRVQADADKREKELRRRAAVTEVFLMLSAVPWIFFPYSNVLDLCAAGIALVGCLLMVWNTYLFYVSTVLPAIAMSARLSGEGISFGDGLVDEERVLFGRIQHRRQQTKR